MYIYEEKTCTGYRARICTFLTKILVLWAWEPNQPAIFVAQGLFGNKVIIHVFRGLDQLSGKSGAEIMVQKQKIPCKFKSHKR